MSDSIDTTDPTPVDVSGVVVTFEGSAVSSVGAFADDGTFVASVGIPESRILRALRDALGEYVKGNRGARVLTNAGNAISKQIVKTKKTRDDLAKLGIDVSALDSTITAMEAQLAEMGLYADPAEIDAVSEDGIVTLADDSDESDDSPADDAPADSDE